MGKEEDVSVCVECCLLSSIMVLSRILNTIKAWREVERAGPQLIKRASARMERVEQSEAERARRAEETMTGLSTAVSNQMDVAQKQKDELLEAHEQILKKALDRVQIDEASVRQRAVSSLLDNWEEHLANVDAKKNKS